MAGTEVPPSVCEISNALANGQDKTEPSQKRRRKSGGNGADAHRDDALDRSGQDQLEEEDRGTLGARGRDGVPLEVVGLEGTCGCLCVHKLCGRLVDKAHPEVLRTYQQSAVLWSILVRVQRYMWVSGLPHASTRTHQVQRYIPLLTRRNSTRYSSTADGYIRSGTSSSKSRRGRGTRE